MEMVDIGKEPIFVLMRSLSVVIVCKNEAGIIEQTLKSLQGLTDDIVVYDNGSTDGTIEKAKALNVQVRQGSWEGFGKTKRKAIALAKYDWILSLDADEAIDPLLKKSLLEFEPANEKIVGEIKFKNFFVDKWLRFGEWGNDKHIRLFNRKQVNWNDAAVHEKLILPEGASVKRIEGNVLHKTVKSVEEYKQKMQQYALLNAGKYHQAGKKATWIKRYGSPVFTFINYYIFRLGFLDGHEGYLCAKISAWYTSLKYKRLRELNKGMGSGK